MTLDLSGAHLIDFTLENAHVGSVNFDGATFAGGAWFVGATFNGDAGFIGAMFTCDARFDRVMFGGGGDFSGVGSRDQIQLNGAQATNLDTKIPNVWPRGWVVRVDPDEPDRGVLVREQGTASASD